MFEEQVNTTLVWLFTLDYYIARYSPEIIFSIGVFSVAGVLIAKLSKRL